jgi:plastocyanin
MKKIFVVLAILFIGILLAGCTSQPVAPVATPVPTAVPTPVVTVPPTSEPVKEVVVVVVNKTEATATATPTPVPTYTITFTQSQGITNGPSATVTVGTKVIWANMDSIYPHGVSGANFGMSTIPNGGTYEFTFDKVGSYSYMTTFQPETSGMIIVTA